MKVALIDYEAGNLHSAAKALERAGTQVGLTPSIHFATRPEHLKDADAIVLPGDGAFRDCREHLASIAGMEEALGDAVLHRAVPFLGICVGMQLLAQWGEERGQTRGLGWLKGRVVPLDPADKTLKIPHMGWNTLDFLRPHPVLAGLAPPAQQPHAQTQPHAYFLHSYHLLPENPANLLATADYGGPVSAIVGEKNFIGTQFHPEKSQGLGLTLLANFLRWKP